MNKRLTCLMLGAVLLVAFTINAHAATITFTGTDQISEIFNFGNSGYSATFQNGDHTLATTLTQSEYLEAFSAFKNYIDPSVSGYSFYNDVNTARGTIDYFYQGFVGMSVTPYNHPPYEIDAAFGGTLNGYIKLNGTAIDYYTVSINTLGWLNSFQNPYSDLYRNTLDTTSDPTKTRVVFSKIPSVPIPGAVWLLGSGLLGLLGFRRKQNS